MSPGTGQFFVGSLVALLLGAVMADALDRKIEALKRWQLQAWRRLAEPLVTPFERREIRNHMKEADAVFRACLEERVRRTSNILPT